MEDFRSILRDICSHGSYGNNYLESSEVKYYVADLKYYKSVVRIVQNQRVLKLHIEPHEQGYGGYKTWLCGDLRTSDAFEISFPGSIPSDYTFGVGHVNHPNPKFSSHFHTIADYHLEDMNKATIRLGKEKTEEYTFIKPEIFYSDAIVVKPGHKLGVAVSPSQVFFYIKDKQSTLSHYPLVLDRVVTQPLRVFFDIYTEETIDIDVRVEDPSLLI